MSRKSLFVLLFVSLALNLFLLGGVAGGLVIGQKFRPNHSPPGRAAPPLWRAAEGLSQDQAQAYRAALRSSAPQMRDAMRAARTARQEAWASLAQEPLDAASLKARLSAIRAQEAQARGVADERIVDFAAALPPTDRATLARGLTEPRSRESRGSGDTRDQGHRR